VGRAFIILLALAMTSPSCEPGGEFAPNTLGTEYFPLQTGTYYIYDVDSTVILANTETQYKYQLRLEVKEEYENAAGNTAFVIQRSKRNTMTDQWLAIDTWSAWTDARSAVVVEGNRSFVKLQFPIQAGSQWNGNEMNSNGGDEDCDGQACDVYDVAYVDPFVKVVQSSLSDRLVRYDWREEGYQKDVGLFLKYVEVLEYCTTQDCFGKQFVDKGVKYSQILTEHGTI
jgi:hypothetical protein